LKSIILGTRASALAIAHVGIDRESIGRGVSPSWSSSARNL